MEPSCGRQNVTAQPETVHYFEPSLQILSASVRLSGLTIIARTLRLTPKAETIDTN